MDEDKKGIKFGIAFMVTSILVVALGVPSIIHILFHHAK